MPFEITLVSIVRALVEVAMLMLAGRGMLWLFGPKARQGNFVYDILTIGVMPFIKATRAITPRIVQDAHIPLATFLLVFFVWLGLGIAKAAMCASQGVQCV